MQSLFSFITDKAGRRSNLRGSRSGAYWRQMDFGSLIPTKQVLRFLLTMTLEVVALSQSSVAVNTGKSGYAVRNLVARPVVEGVLGE